jgi:hypothetical protein
MDSVSESVKHNTFQNCITQSNSSKRKGSFENVSEFKCKRTTVTNQNLITQEIRRRFNSGSACFHSEPKSSLFSSVVEILKNCNIQDYNFCLWFCGGVKLGL